MKLFDICVWRYQMSLDKAIQHGKEHRKPYRGSKAFDSSCRNHGSCDWCRNNRLHKFKKEYEEQIDELRSVNDLNEEIIENN